jgi:hypothetical protein
MDTALIAAAAVRRLSHSLVLLRFGRIFGSFRAEYPLATPAHKLAQDEMFGYLEVAGATYPEGASSIDCIGSSRANPKFIDREAETACLL